MRLLLKATRRGAAAAGLLLVVLHHLLVLLLLGLALPVPRLGRRVRLLGKAKVLEQVRLPEQEVEPLLGRLGLNRQGAHSMRKTG